VERKIGGGGEYKQGSWEVRMRKFVAVVGIGETEDWYAAH